MQKDFSIVVAVDCRGGIGKAGGLPWKLPGDMSFFKRLTSSVSAEHKVNAVLMGRKTWDSIPPKFRPLKGRLNIVISRQTKFDLPEGVVLAGSLDAALGACDRSDVESVFVIGGGAIYAEALKEPSLKRIYCTSILQEFDCDTFLPPFDENFVHLENQDSEVFCENDTQYVFKIFERKTVATACTSPQ